MNRRYALGAGMKRAHARIDEEAEKRRLARGDHRPRCSCGGLVVNGYCALCHCLGNSKRLVGLRDIVDDCGLSPTEAKERAS